MTTKQKPPGGGKKGPGRPATGEPVRIRLSPEERAVAARLGSGNVSRGVRLALALAAPHPE
jgi:hypothetical protein